MSKHKYKSFAVLDLGSHKMVCFIVRLTPEGDYEITGIGHQVSQGIRAGVITDVRAAETCILACVHAAEQMAGETVDSVYLNVSGAKVQSHILSVEKHMGAKEITDADIEMMIEDACSHLDLDQQEIIHCFPIEYVLDGESGIQDPRGMFGHMLRARLHIITAPTMMLLNTANCLARCHLNVTECILSAYASSLACLTEDEKKMGAALVDLGAAHTNIAVFKEGHMIHSACIPVGGGHVTHDIAWALSTNHTHAERVKTLYGNTVGTVSDIREHIEVPMGEEDGDQVQQITRAMLVEILRPRVEEILEAVKHNLVESGVFDTATSKLVLTGGASQMAGLKELANYIFHKPIRVASPVNLPGLAESTAGPAFATAVGLIQYVTDQEDDILHQRQKTMFAGGAVKKMVSWLKKNF